MSNQVVLLGITKSSNWLLRFPIESNSLFFTSNSNLLCILWNFPLFAFRGVPKGESAWDDYLSFSEKNSSLLNFN